MSIGLILDTSALLVHVGMERVSAGERVLGGGNGNRVVHELVDPGTGASA